MKFALASLFLLAACAEEPARKDAEKPAEAFGKEEVKAQKRSIEEAADEAAKLVEADAKAEIELAGTGG